MYEFESVVRTVLSEVDKENAVKNTPDPDLPQSKTPCPSGLCSTDQKSEQKTTYSTAQNPSMEERMKLCDDLAKRWAFACEIPREPKKQTPEITPEFAPEKDMEVIRLHENDCNENALPKEIVNVFSFCVDSKYPDVFSHSWYDVPCIKTMLTVSVSQLDYTAFNFLIYYVSWKTEADYHNYLMRKTLSEESYIDLTSSEKEILAKMHCILGLMFY